MLQTLLPKSKHTGQVDEMQSSIFIPTQVIYMIIWCDQLRIKDYYHCFWLLSRLYGSVQPRFISHFIDVILKHTRSLTLRIFFNELVYNCQLKSNKNRTGPTAAACLEKGVLINKSLASSGPDLEADGL